MPLDGREQLERLGGDAAIHRSPSDGHDGVSWWLNGGGVDRCVDAEEF